VLLTPWVVAALRDYERQSAALRRGSGEGEPHFVVTDLPDLPGQLPGDVWAHPSGAVRR
jgi:alanine or glycine:cation symporter, AGCS family